MPSGQRAYLSRLVCPDGSSPAFSRVGNMGPRTNFPANLSDSEQLALLRKVLGAEKLAPGDPDYHTIDGYEVGCGTSKRVLYLDMYHCQQPPPVSAPKGYTLKPVD